MSSFIRGKAALIISIASLLFCTLSLFVVISIRGEDSAAEGEKGQASGFYIPPDPQPGDPWVGVVLDGGDVILEKGVWLEYPAYSDPTEVMRLTHEGFIVVGERKIHIDILAAVIERLAVVHAVREDKGEEK